MKSTIRKYWAEAYDFIAKRPVVILPFIIIAFFECLALELIFFSTRNPISYLANPIIRKFFGEAFAHYPMNMVLLPKLFYYSQIVLYAILGVFMTGLSVNIFKNVRAGLPLVTGAILKNGLKRYLSFVLYGILVSVLLVLLRRADIFLFKKLVRLILEFFPTLSPQLYRIAITLFLLLTNVIMQAFLILTIPVMVLENKFIPRAVFRSVYLGARNFLTVFGIIFLPFMLYTPIVLLMSFSDVLVKNVAPEITFYLTLINIVMTIFIDCFILICVSQFLTDKNSEGAAR